ncbi:MAG: OmpH family outer membrane protein, partial [Desulfosarcina sp.]
VMSKEMREEKEREFRIKINDIKTLQKKYEVELQGIQKKLMGGLQDETLEIIDEIGKSGGYLLIMDKRGVLYSPSTVDITDEVIKKYNAQYAKTKKWPTSLVYGRPPDSKGNCRANRIHASSPGGGDRRQGRRQHRPNDPRRGAL